MKKQTKPAITRTQIIEAIKEAGRINLAGLRAKFPNARTNRISIMLWQMKKAGTLTHDASSGWYTLTDVNKKEAEPVEQPKVAPAVKDKQLHAAQRDAKYWKEVAEMRMEVITRMRGEHEDALSVIRYLEEKLFKAIQFDARNGRNS